MKNMAKIILLNYMRVLFFEETIVPVVVVTIALLGVLNTSWVCADVARSLKNTYDTVSVNEERISELEEKLENNSE